MPRPCLMASHRRLGRLSLVDNTDLGPSVDWPTSFDARLIVPKNGHFLFTINTTKDSKFKHLESRQKVKSRAQESSFEIFEIPMLPFWWTECGRHFCKAKDVFWRNSKAYSVLCLLYKQVYILVQTKIPTFCHAMKALSEPNVITWCYQAQPNWAISLGLGLETFKNICVVKSKDKSHLIGR